MSLQPIKKNSQQLHPYPNGYIDRLHALVHAFAVEVIIRPKACSWSDDVGEIGIGG